MGLHLRERSRATLRELYLNLYS
eukprot:SAG11_NODE_4242_length_1991_cov_3.034884_5_plen_22_part_01